MCLLKADITCYRANRDIQDSLHCIKASVASKQRASKPWELHGRGLYTFNFPAGFIKATPEHLQPAIASSGNKHEQERCVRLQALVSWAKTMANRLQVRSQL
jgi:hypothetical protein